MLAVRTGDLVPAGCRLGQDDHFRALLVLSEYFVLRARSGAQTKRVAVRTDLVHHAAGGGLRSQLHLWCHSCWHRSADNVALHQPQPFALGVQRVLQLKLILAIEGFRNGTGGRRYHTHAIGGEVNTFGAIDTYHRATPPSLQRSPVGLNDHTDHISRP